MEIFLKNFFTAVCICAFVAGIRLGIPYLFKKYWNKEKLDKSDKQRVLTKENDKLILVTGVTESEIKQVLQQFCNLYNLKPDEIQTTITTSTQFKIAFPNNLDFEIFCFLINYLKYPEGINYTAEVLAWSTVYSSDSFVNSKIANQHLMIYIDPSDSEFDNVFITTERNTGYKLDFGGKITKLESPIMDYVLSK